jgi:hypothetical protein
MRRQARTVRRHLKTLVGLAEVLEAELLGSLHEREPRAAARKRLRDESNAEQLALGRPSTRAVLRRSQSEETISRGAAAARSGVALDARKLTNSLARIGCALAWRVGVAR